MKYILVFLLTMIIQIGYTQFTFEGNITNEGGEPLIGASVFFSETDYATITDENGHFLFESLPEDKMELKVTYVGYISYVNELEMNSNQSVDIVLKSAILNIDEIEIIANKLNEKSPFAYSEMSSEEIGLENLGQDMPFLLEQLPSVVVTSDAGAGIGYTSMRVRGSDATRVNVTINGVPLNDSESHGLFWVNLPDFGSSVDKLQLQRGVGPSTNGSGSFGATLGLNTNYIHQNPFIKISGTYGSFNTQKISANFGTGLINDQFTLEGRYSSIKSDGYIDRATSDLNSWYFSAAQIKENSSLRLNVFSGKERTYQSWFGAPESRVEGDMEALMTHYLNNKGVTYVTEEDSLNLFNSDRRYNYYLWRNQVDDYRQTHSQLIYNKNISSRFRLNATGHYTRGKGFFEQYKNDEDFADYNLDPQSNNLGEEFENADIVRRKWLDNHFYGVIANLEYDAHDDLKILFGASANRYDGGHFGNPVFSPEVGLLQPDFRYYDNKGVKDDFNSYVKADFNANEKLSFFGDLQFRKINYSVEGIHDDMRTLDIDESYNFFNPKLGLNYILNTNTSFYLSYAKGSREPVRDDFIDAVGLQIPEAETMNDFEAGLRWANNALLINANLYFMDYQNQLVLTGALNDVGGPVRQNVPDSYRAGLELAWTYMFTESFSWSANMTLSQNKIKNFTEFIADYENGGFIENQYEDTDIALSPNFVSNSQLRYKLKNGIDISLISKYVGSQFLDNTSNDNRKLDAYFVSDIILAKKIKASGLDNLEFKLMVNNLFDVEYSSNGYHFNYFVGELIEENYLYPQAGINFLLGATFTF